METWETMVVLILSCRQWWFENSQYIPGSSFVCCNVDGFSLTSSPLETSSSTRENKRLSKILPYLTKSLQNNLVIGICGSHMIKNWFKIVTQYTCDYQHIYTNSPLEHNYNHCHVNVKFSPHAQYAQEFRRHFVRWV